MGCRERVANLLNERWFQPNDAFVTTFRTYPEPTPSGDITISTISRPSAPTYGIGETMSQYRRRCRARNERRRSRQPYSSSRKLIASSKIYIAVSQRRRTPGYQAQRIVGRAETFFRCFRRAYRSSVYSVQSLIPMILIMPEMTVTFRSPTKRTPFRAPYSNCASPASTPQRWLSRQAYLICRSSILIVPVARPRPASPN
jgi:hypothetical protein